MEKVATLVARAYPAREPAEIAAMRAFAWWNKAVPPKIVKNARPVQLRRGVLTVHTSTSAWANTLQYEAEELLASIKRHAPEARIKKLVFRVGLLPDMPVIERPSKPKPKTVPLVELPEGIARELARIDDDEIRDTVGRAVATGLSVDGPARRTKREPS
jgi:hypothetical protein